MQRYTSYTRNTMYTLLFLLLLGCNVRGDVGNGTDQGTCPNVNQVCNNDGTCSGTHYYITPNTITINDTPCI